MLCSTEIKFADLQLLQTELLNFSGEKSMLVMNKTGAKRWALENFATNFKIWIDDVSANPSEEFLLELVGKTNNCECETIVAIGGGSVIDLAKGIAFYAKPHPNIVAVPTTAGTGSEVTEWATFWKKDGKVSLDAPFLKPKYAFICSEFLETLPREILISTGLDAMSHAIEAYWSRYSTPLVKDLSIRSLQLMQCHFANEKEIEYLSRGSLLSGLAFSQTRTTACHAISYPLTYFYGIKHGMAAAITIPAVFEMNKHAIKRTDELEEYIEFIKQFTCSLSKLNVPQKDFPIIAEHALKSGRMENNPVNLDKEQIISILQKCF